MSDDEKLLVEVCMNCKNYICGLCLHLDHWVEDDDWSARGGPRAWERDHPGQQWQEHQCQVTDREYTDYERWERKWHRSLQQKRA
jgi:hypothetical protein